MKKQYPSIFNDVIGPVMRGPSSSHCAGSLRIGLMSRDLMEGSIREALIEYDPNGALVTTHKSHGTDMGLYSGFLGYDTSDVKLLNYKREIKKAGISIKVKYVSYGAKHPNTYRITLKNDRWKHRVTALSTGGGMIEIVDIDGAAVSMQGDLWETLVFVKPGAGRLVDEFAGLVEAEEISIRRANARNPIGRAVAPSTAADGAERRPYQKIHAKACMLTEKSLKKCNNPFILISTAKPIQAAVINKIKNHASVNHVAVINPVLPVITRRNIKLPFRDFGEMIRFNKKRKLKLWELAVAYESARGNISEAEVIGKMRAIVRIMTGAIEAGLKGTRFADRILPAQSLLFKKKMAGGKLINDPVLNRIILYVSALMETKSSMGVIVAAPTAGACGALPGAVIGTGRELNVPEEEVVRAMLAAGLIGVFITGESTFAAESAGCQAECGSASGMAAAGLVHLAGGDLQQSMGAASMALQNSFGMTCDPIANRVEAPCLGKNVMAAANALSCANMALAGYKHLIPFDEVLNAFDKAGRSLPRELRCTALGGLSVTKTARQIESSLSRG